MGGLATATGRLRAAVRPWRRRALALRARRGFASQLLWILGSPRSGSTWVLHLLAKHEAVVPVNEPQIGAFLSPFLCDLPGWDPAGLDASNFTLRKVESDKADAFFADQFRDVTTPALGQLIVKRFLAHAIRRPAAVPLSRTLVAIKEPNGSQSADLLMAAQPDARLLFLLRDGRDVVDSELAANLNGAWVSKQFAGAVGIDDDARMDFVIQSAYKWLWRTETVQQAYAAHRGPKHLLRYEDLLDEPMTRMRALLDWLGLDVEDGELDGWIHKHSFDRIPARIRGPEAFFRAARPGSWRENLAEGEQEAVEAILGPKLRELGYDARPVRSISRG
jgi:hypothetical protein